MPQNAEQPHPYYFHYFLPGQLLLVVEHDPNAGIDEIMGALGKEGALQRFQGIQIDSRDILTFNIDSKDILTFKPDSQVESQSIRFQKARLKSRDLKRF